MRFRVSAVLVAVILTVVAGRAQQIPTQQQTLPSIDTPIFRSNVDAVELDAFVVDAAGNPVTDLTVDDFEILEDGRPQPITSFGVIDIPIERVEAPTASRIIPDVRSNQQPEGRIYLIAIDEISPSLVGTASRSPATVRRAAFRRRTTPPPSSTSAAAARRTDRTSPAIERCCSAQLTG